MKTRLWGLGIVLIGSAMALACVRYVYQGTAPGGPAATEVAPADGSDQPFYDDLAPYGRWVYVAGPGWVWSPHSVQAGWRPYQLGHWVFTDHGWTWASDEQWGWAVYHYGRWHQDTSYGWVWVPGTEWGPAWVAWHEGGGYVGWAPLPWQVRFRAGVGLDWGRAHVTIAPSSWCFVSARNLVDPGLRNHIVPASRNVRLIQVTRNVTNYTYIDNRVVNQGVKVEAIVKATGRTIPRYRVAETDAPETARGGKVKGHDFVVFRPKAWRGRASQGRAVPPGHDETHQQGDSRSTAVQPDPGPPASAPPEPPETTRGQETRDRERESHQSRGRKIFDQLKGKQTPRRSPQEPGPSQPGASQPAPSQPAAPAQPPAAPDQTSAPAARPSTPAGPPAEARTGGPAQGDQPGVTTPKANQEPTKGQPAKPGVMGRKKADAKGKKGKPEASKSDESDADETKKEKPDEKN